MRAPFVLAALLLAGCLAAGVPEGRVVGVLGGLVGTEATVLPASVGGGPAPTLVVEHAGVSTRATVGEGVSLPLSEGGAILRLLSHGEWVRTSLRWSDPACTVSMRTPTLDQVRDDPRIPVENAVTSASPYVQYSLGGACSGDVFVLWRG